MIARFPVRSVSEAIVAVLLLAGPVTAQLHNIAPTGTATQSSEFGGYPASLAIDLNFDNFTVTAPDDPAPSWEVALPESHTIKAVRLHNRRLCCPERLRDITLSVLDAPGGAVEYESDLLNPGNSLGGPAVIELTLPPGVLGAVVRVARTPDPAGVGDDRAIISLGEVEVLVDDTPQPILILSQPVGARAEIGSSFELSVAATGPDPLAYQWKKGGSNVSGTTASLLLEDLEPEDAGTYTVVISNGEQSVESDPAELVVVRRNIARAGVAIQSTDFGAFPATLAIDGSYGNFTATASADEAPTWEVDLGGDATIDEIIVFNRGDGCCQSRLRDIIVSIHDVSFIDDPFSAPLFESDFLNEENVLGGGTEAGPAALEVAVNPAVTGRYVRVARLPDPDLSGTGGLGGGDEVSLLSIGEVEVHGSAGCPVQGHPEFGDTHCDGVTIDGPVDQTGLYTATVAATDATGGDIFYSIRADNGFSPAAQGPVGPSPSMDFDLFSVGRWTVTATVDDNLLCEDAAADSTCSELVEIQAPASANKALLRPTRQSTDWNGQFPARLAVDGDYTNFTATSTGDDVATWELDLLGPVAIRQIVLHNRQNCCPSRLRDITVSIVDADGVEVVFETELLNPENVLGGGTVGGPALLDLKLSELAGGPVTGRYVRVRRTPDPDLSGSAGLGGVDETTILSLGEVEVFDTDCGPPASSCTGIEVVGPEIGGPGPCTVTASGSGDTIFYTFSADNGQDPPLVAGPQDLPIAVFNLTPATWTISVAVSDSLRCPPVPAAACTEEVEVEPLCRGTNVALSGTASQTTDYAAFTANLAIDGNPATFTATGPTDPAPSWQVDLGATIEIATIVLQNRPDCCPERLRDITVAVLDASGTEIEFESALLNPGNELFGPPSIVLDLEDETGAKVPGRYVRVSRTPDAAGVGDDAVVLSLGEVQVCDGTVGPVPERFHRGDANDDGSINITDGIFILNFLFLGGPTPSCQEAANPNDDASINITDGIFVLNYLFLGGPAPAAPGPTTVPCGVDPPGASNLGCAQYTKC